MKISDNLKQTEEYHILEIKNYNIGNFNIFLNKKVLREFLIFRGKRPRKRAM